MIAANVELRERELVKLSTWADALAAALGRRGIEEPAATLAAEAGMAAFRVAFEQWTAHRKVGLDAAIRGAVADLKAAAGY